MITRLYDVPVNDRNFVLLRHRAALFAPVSIACFWAAFVDDQVERLSLTVVGFSMTSFLGVFYLHGRPQNLKTIAVADALALPLLAVIALNM